jgi:hypothetical protein
MTTTDSAADVLPIFQREERYIVVKLSRLSHREEMEGRLRSMIERYAGKHTLVDCVVVESDWPEYEPVWAMIEARCTGRTAQAGGDALLREACEQIRDVRAAIGDLEWREELVWLVKRIDAHLSRPRPARDEALVEAWQPWASAPKDGTIILAYGEHLPTYFYATVWEKGEWRYCSQGSGWASPPAAPTHWRPLPPPPAPQGQKP